MKLAREVKAGHRSQPLRHVDQGRERQGVLDALAVHLPGPGDTDGVGEHELVGAGQIAASIGVSRSTAQRYLSELARQGTVELRLHYGAAGRPEHRYRLSAAS